MELDVTRWHNYPMGPKLKKFLGISISDYGGRSAPKPSETLKEEFGQFLSEYIRVHPVETEPAILDVHKELLAMDLNQQAVDIVEKNAATLVGENTLRGLLTLGSAACLRNDFDAALDYFFRAQQMSPEEPSVYQNIIQVLYRLERDEECEKYCLASLELEPNTHQTWEILAAIYQAKLEKQAGEALKQRAQDFDSWAGLSLAAQLIAPEDALYRAEVLENLYKGGLRDSLFLTEFTAALGVAQQYEKIPPIIESLSANNSQEEPIPWVLNAHCAQAYLGMEKKEQALVFLQKTLEDPNIPPGHRQELKNLEDELTNTNEGKL